MFVFACGVVFSGCGHFRAGQWEDDPDNWSRAFGESKPADGIAIVHSRYMRTAHWSLEFAWFFALELTAEAKAGALRNPELVRLPDFSERDLQRRVFADRPEWFLPKPLAEYDVYEMGAGSDFLLFMERGSDRSFWTAFQL